MTLDFSAAMRRALQLTRAQNVMEATQVIQRALTGRGAALPVDKPLASVRLLAPPLDVVETADAAEPSRQTARAASADNTAPEPRPSGRPRRPLGEVLKLLRRADLPGLHPGSAPTPALRKAPPVPVPEGAAYLARTFTCAAGSRDYKVYVPSGAEGRALPLIVMLHGCAQTQSK